MGLSGYDTAGNLLTRADALNQTTTYAYDALSRMQTQVVSNGPSFICCRQPRPARRTSRNAGG